PIPTSRMTRRTGRRCRNPGGWCAMLAPPTGSRCTVRCGQRTGASCTRWACVAPASPRTPKDSSTNCTAWPGARCPA
ncbi:MAG: hypothetical protein AVDCRST_MAG88-1617, partial [uncultured Thermomicrobiales bacterium]